jgi:polyisoprenoid-binding protein YceI
MTTTAVLLRKTAEKSGTARALSRSECDVSSRKEDLMFHVRLVSLLCAASLLARAEASPARGSIELAIDPTASQVVIEVGKSGMLSFAGHLHEVTAPVQGRVMFDPDDWRRSSVSLDFDAAALKVTGKGESPAEVPEVQRVMLSDQVLDTKRYPRITFTSQRISVDARSGNTGTVIIDGELTLHGATHPVTIRASATLEASGRLTARGTFSFNQTDFGITPVAGGAGTVRVKDALDVQFVLAAHRRTN